MYAFHSFIMNKTLKIVSGFALALVLAGVSSASAYTFNTNLSKGMTSPDVKALQQVLNSNASTQVAASGVGSAGYESMYFGALTKTAVMKFQTAHGISPVGIVGPMTRAILNNMGGGTSTTYPAGCTSAVGFSSTTGASCATGVITNNSGPLSVMLSTDNPASGYVISNQAQADLAHFTFTGSGTINSITLMRTGISDQNTLSNVYLYNGTTRLTDGYSFNNSGVLTMNNIGVMVNGSMNISVKADISSTAGTTATSVGVTLTGYTAGATASTANVAGNMMAVGLGSPATVYLATQASVAVPNASVNAGTSSYTVWSAPVQVNTRTVMLKGANFRMIGSAPAGALANIHLYVDGVATGNAANVAPINGTNYAMFDFSAAPVSLSTGSHTVDVRADVVTGSSYTVQVSLQQAADLVLFDSQLGINIAPAVNYTTAFTSNAAGTITINAGSASVVIDPTFSAMTNITGGATNVDIAKFKIHGYGEDVKVSTLSVLPVMSNSPVLASGSCTANTNCSLNNVTIYFNGSQVGSQQNWDGTSTLSFNLGSQLIVPAATDSTIEVRADLQNASSVNYTAGSVAATLKTGSSNGQGQTSHTTLNFPTSDVAGTSLAIQTGLLAVSKNAGYSNQNANPNTAGVKIGSFTLQNQSSSEGVNVTSLVVALGGSESLTNISNLRTSETSGSGSTPVQPAASNTFSVNFTLAPGATKTIDILADTSTATSVTAIASLTVTSLGQNSHVSVLQNGNGTAVVGQTITLAAGTINTTPTLLTASATTSQYVASANGTTDGTKATYNFAATNGSATITELKFTANGATTVTSVRVGSVSAPVVGGVAYLTGLSLAVPNGSSGLNQDVYVSYPIIGTNGLSSGVTSQLSLTYVKYSSGGTTTSFTPAITAPTMTLVGSKPVVSATKPSTVVAVGNVEAIDVTVAADANGNIALNTLPITVTPSNATLGTSANTIIVKDANNTTVATTNTAFSSGGSTSVVTFTGGYTIQGGQSQTFKIYVPVATTTPSGVNSVSLSTLTASGSNFSWTDVAGGAGSAQTGTTLIPSYPSTFTSVIYN